MSAQVLNFPVPDMPAPGERPRLVLVPPPAPGPGPTYRLTRRGRLVVASLVAALLAMLALAVGTELASATGAPTSITVESGDTLSEIAARELPELSVTDAVVELQLANRLSTSQIHAGQTLVIPAH